MAKRNAVTPTVEQCQKETRNVRDFRDTPRFLAPLSATEANCHGIARRGHQARWRRNRHRDAIGAQHPTAGADKDHRIAEDEVWAIAMGVFSEPSTSVGSPIDAGVAGWSRIRRHSSASARLRRSSCAARTLARNRIRRHDFADRDPRWHRGAPLLALTGAGLVCATDARTGRPTTAADEHGGRRLGEGAEYRHSAVLPLPRPLPESHAPHPASRRTQSS